MTTALALGESLALESGVGTLSIIQNLHLAYKENKEKKKNLNKTAFYTHHYTIDLQVSLE